MRSVPTGQRAIPNPPTPVFQKTEGEAGRHSRLQRGQCEAPASGEAGSRGTAVRRGIVKRKAWRSHWVEERGTVNATGFGGMQKAGRQILLT